MRESALAIVLVTLLLAGTASPSLAASPPCEDALKALRAAAARATPGVVDKSKVADLEAKGVERRSADDDKRADDFFAQAMTVVGK